MDVFREEEPELHALLGACLRRTGRPALVNTSFNMHGEPIVASPREMPGVRLAIGSNAGSVWWVNDQEVIALYNDRQSVIDDGVSRRLTLRKGLNVVRAAVVNAGGALTRLSVEDPSLDAIYSRYFHDQGVSNAA